MSYLHLENRTCSGLGRVARERRRQIEREGYDAAHDDEHDDGSLAMVAASYASPLNLFTVHGACSWPNGWDPAYDKRELHPRVRQLEIAGALICAEIDRLSRLAESQGVPVEEVGHD